MKAQRNDPCPCGSGKKFKKCCLVTEAGPPVDLLWSRLRGTREAIPAKILRFVKESCISEVLELAQIDFYFGTPREHDDGSWPDSEAFWMWFFFNWEPMADVWRERPADRRRLSIGERFLAAKGDRLPELERRTIEEEIRQPFSVYEVGDVRKGSGFVLSDIFRGGRFEVTERTASSLLREGDLIYTKLLTFDHLVLLAGIAEIALEPDAKIPFLDLAEEIRPKGGITAGTLKREADAIRGLYLSLADRRRNPVLPRLMNTDGEALALHKLEFEIASAEEATGLLADLEVTSSKDDVLARAERGPGGRIARAEIHWSKKKNSAHGGLDNTSLGLIAIAGRALTVEVNSRERSERIRAEIERRLGDRVKHARTVISNMEKMIEEARHRPPTPMQRKAQELQDLPEVRAKLREILEAHYETWIDEKLPALGGETPSEAVRHPLGRAKVEALLATMERRPQTESGNEYDFNRIRTRLGFESAVPRSDRRPKGAR